MSSLSHVTSSHGELEFADNPILLAGEAPESAGSVEFSGYDIGGEARPKRPVSAKPRFKTQTKNGTRPTSTSHPPPAHPPPVSLPSPSKKTPSREQPRPPPPPMPAPPQLDLSQLDRQIEQEQVKLKPKSDLSPDEDLPEPDILEDEQDPWHLGSPMNASTLPPHMRAVVNREPVPPSPVDETEEWKPPMTARSGVRPPPQRPKSAKSARSSRDGRTPPATITTRNISVSRQARQKTPRVKQGHWTSPSKQKEGMPSKVADGLDDQLPTIQLRNGLPIRDSRGSTKSNPRMSKRRSNAAPPMRESRSRNSSNGSTGSEFEYETEEFDGTGFQHVNRRSVTKKGQDKGCIVA